MPRPTSFDRVSCPRVVMSCHTRRRLTVCAVQVRWCHAMHDVLRLCVLPSDDDIMPHPTSFDRVCCPKAVMSCHAQRSLTVCAAQMQ